MVTKLQHKVACGVFLPNNCHLISPLYLLNHIPDFQLIVLDATVRVFELQICTFFQLAVVRQVLRKELGLKIVEVESDKALVEGGDVLWTGKLP